MKKIPIRIRFWASSIADPPRRVVISKQAGSGPADPGRRSSRRRCQLAKAGQNQPPAAITNGVSEKPKGSTGELSGISQPQLLACSTPKTTRASPVAESTLPTQSSCGAGPRAAGSRIQRVPKRIPSATTTSPTNTSRQVKSVVTQPPRIGPTAMPAPATPPSTP